MYASMVCYSTGVRSLKLKFMVITLSLPGLQQLFLSLCTGENFDKKREIIKNEKCESEVICGGFQSPEVEK